MSYYKYCFVPCCRSTSLKDPDKKFIFVPTEPRVRTRWFQEASRAYMRHNGRTSFFCCIDHFSYPDDFENYVKHSLTNCNLKVKKGVYPRFFECQKDISNTKTSKRKRKDPPKVRKGVYPGFFECEKNISSTKTSKRKDPLEVVEAVLETGPNGDCERLSAVLPGTDRIVSSLKKFTVTAVPPQTPDTNATVVPVSEKSVQVCFSRSRSSRLKCESSETEDESCCVTENLIRSDPLRCLGINKRHYFLVNKLSHQLNLSHRDVLICLLKIRLDDSFGSIGEKFNLKEPDVRNIFSKTLPSLSHALSGLVKFDASPNGSMLNKLLRCNFNNLVFIDCFEIPIEKPVDPIHQALTRSDSEKRHLVKYLVCFSLYGFVHFISQAFGGSVSLEEVVVSSGFLEKLPRQSLVLASDGFKQSERLFLDRDCTLVLTSSPSGNEALSRPTLEADLVSSLSGHVPSLIQRFKRFALLNPRSSFDSSLVHKLDHIVLVVSGLLNLQPVILRSFKSQ